MACSTTRSGRRLRSSRSSRSRSRAKARPPPSAPRSACSTIRITDDGWTAEILIPLTTLRFADTAQQTRGINFMRNIRRKNEQVFWAPIPKAYSLTRVSQAGSLVGLESFNHGVDLKLKPYVVSGVRDTKTSASLQTTSFLRDVGFDVKYGVTGGMNVDVTYNTDFAQVEVDEQQVNLTRFSLFFPEKRDFFLENAGQFKMGTGGTFTSTTVETDLFFSRRITCSRAERRSARRR